MRTIILLAAIVAALGMASQPTDARDRGFSFRNFSGDAGPKLHLRHHGLKFHHGGVFGKPRPFKSRHFGHFGGRAQRSLAFGSPDSEQTSRGPQPEERSATNRQGVASCTSQAVCAQTLFDHGSVFQEADACKIFVLPSDLALETAEAIDSYDHS
jgi:hypothetical protein